MIWDGLGFFGTSTHKLDRLRGKKVTLWTRFSTAQAQFIVTLYLICVIMVCIFELGKLGSVASVKIDLITNNKYKYDTNEGLMIMYGQWLMIDDLIPKVRDWQNKNRESDYFKKHP